MNKSMYLNTVTIIGHPIHLEHLLRTLKFTGHAYDGTQLVGDTLKISCPNGDVTRFTEELGGGRYDSGENYEWGGGDYDLTLSFSENMKDSALVSFLYERICEK